MKPAGRHDNATAREDSRGDKSRRTGIPHESEPGASSWRDSDGHKHSPIYSGYAFEDFAWLAEREEAFRVSGLPESDRLLFEGGWRAGSEGKGPAVWSDQQHPAWKAGWEAYPRKTWVDPYESFHEDYAARLTLEEQDEVTRKIKAKAKRTRRSNAVQSR